MHRQLKQNIAAGIGIALLIGQFNSIPVYALDEESVKTSLGNATYLFEQAIEESMQQAEKQVKDLIIADNLDYRMTMDSFYEQPNPYIETDYLDLITAYMIARDKTGLTDGDLYELPLVEASIEKKTVEEYVPEKIAAYKARDGDVYELTGNTYISEPMEVPVYEKRTDGFYDLTEQVKQINPKKRSVSYGQVSLCGMTYKDILEQYGVADEESVTRFKTQKRKLEDIVSGKGLSESVFISTIRTDLLSEDIKAYIASLNADHTLSSRRKYLLSRAVSMVGRVPYEWGGKPTNGSYDSRWWTINGSGKQKGLDCSGFVQWCFFDSQLLASLTKIKELTSTSTILINTTAITEADLQPGDLGLLHNGTSPTTNHVGIYMGDGYWIHCSSSSGTVTIEQTDMFKVFRQMPDDTGEAEEFPVSEYTATPIRCDYTDEDVYLLAQLCYNEANTEGLNGWIAVAEVVKNRVNSPLFPDSIREVVYQDDPVQFSNSKMIAKREPTEEQINIVKQVLNGTTGILNDENVLYFRNAGGSTDDWGNYPYYMTIHHHQFYKQSNEESEI